MRNKKIGSGKPKGVSKSPWVCRIRKRVKDAQGKQMGQGCSRKKNGTKEPTSNEMGQEKPIVA